MNQIKEQCCERCAGIHAIDSSPACALPACRCHKEFPEGKEAYCPQCYFQNEMVVLRKDCGGHTPPPHEDWEKRVLEICEGDPIAVTWIAMTKELLSSHRTALLEQVKEILEDEIRLAHTTRAGRTSRLTSAYDRISALTRLEERGKE